MIVVQILAGAVLIGLAVHAANLAVELSGAIGAAMVALILLRGGVEVVAGIFRR